ncbi:sugar isomerase domain-containing protein [Bacillus salipaludis]|uniref:Sugar isomerase domain-containing protein n=1 Tax=Bacillus salipaludis TaxID=2547811 RepID=A0ABW8RJX1_9BACI
MISAEAYLENANKYIQCVKETQFSTIKRIAEILADCITKDGVIHVFGTGHSKSFAGEMAFRAGGLVPMHAMYLEDLLRKGVESVDDINDLDTERDPKVAHRLLALYDIRPTDAVILVSNSGRNGSMIEMAMELKSRGLPIICVTSLEHTKQVTSRHPSGKKLFEVADYVIDNCGPYGDALSFPGLETKVCAISSITGILIAQCLTAEIINNLTLNNHPIPAYISANVDGADEHNNALREKYKGRI